MDATYREYTILCKPGAQGRVRRCLERLGLSVDEVRESGDGDVEIVAGGMCDHTPSQLERELHELGCLSVDVDDGYTDARSIDDPEVRGPNDGVEMASDPDDYGADFDAELANDVLDRANALLDVGGSTDEPDVMGQGDADRDQGWFRGPGRQTYEAYLQQCVRTMVNQYGLTREEARDELSACIDDCVEQGYIDPPPEDDAPDYAFSQWTGAAKGAELMAKCLQRIDPSGE